MTAEVACEWGFLLFRFYLRPCRPWVVLRKIFLQRHLAKGGILAPPNHGYRFLGLRVALGTNEILGGHSHHKSLQCSAIRRRGYRVLGLRWFLGPKCNTHSFFRYSFLAPFPLYGGCVNAFVSIASDRQQQPPGRYRS